MPTSGDRLEALATARGVRAPHDRMRGVGGRASAPPLRPGIVDRPMLVEGLLAATAHAPLILVSAPAGYGKTTLLAQWRERDDREFAWLTLEPWDNDPVVLVGAVIATLADTLGLDSALGADLALPEPDLDGAILPALVDACTASGRRCVLVLDDLHLVTEPRCHHVLDHLARHLPPSCQLAWGTRTDPAVHLASMRAHGRLVEVRASDLALTEDEAAHVLASSDVHVTPERLSQLVERTEGWPAGIYLAALSMRASSDPDAYIERFAGTSRHVADFLSEDVLGQQGDAVVDFMLASSVLDELTGSLCAEVTGRADAQEMLRGLATSNLFVVPLDEEGEVYRYHRLFAEYLRAELTRRDPANLPELHRRAYSWYRRRGLAGPAIQHAQAAGEVQAAATLVASQYRSLAQVGHTETVKTWVSGFTDEQIEAHTPLTIVAAWIAALEGDEERTARVVEVARRGSWSGPMPDGTASLESALALMPQEAGVSRMHRDAQLATSLEPDDSPWRPIALLRLGIAAYLRGDFPSARDALDEAIELGAEGTSTQAVALSVLAWVDLREHDSASAWEHARAASRFMERPGLSGYMPGISTFSAWARVTCERGDEAAATAAIAQVDDLLPKSTSASWWLVAHAQLLLAPVLASLGRVDEACDRLDRVDALLRSHPDNGRLDDWLRQTVLALRPPRHAPPATDGLSPAESRILRMLGTDLSLREIGDELCLSLNTVKTHTHAIYRKLGVSSRAEAARLARNVRQATH